LTEVSGPSPAAPRRTLQFANAGRAATLPKQEGKGKKRKPGAPAGSSPGPPLNLMGDA
jgi:hypothetical protein